MYPFAPTVEYIVCYNHDETFGVLHRMTSKQLDLEDKAKELQSPEKSTIVVASFDKTLYSYIIMNTRNVV